MEAEDKETKYIPQVTFITYDDYEKVVKEVEADNEDPLKLDDYVNLILMQLAEEGCINISLQIFDKLLLNPNTFPKANKSQIMVRANLQYLFMITFKSPLNYDEVK